MVKTINQNKCATFCHKNLARLTVA